MSYILVASHRRSGTHFLIDSLINNLSGISYKYLNLDELLKPKQKNSEFGKNFLNYKKDVIIKTHTLLDFETFSHNKQAFNFIQRIILPNVKIIYVIRDGRDVMVSLYNYLIRTGTISNQLSFRDFLESKNNFDNIFLDQNRIEFWRNHLKSWLDKPNVLYIKYEDLHNDFKKTLGNIALFLNKDLNKILERPELKKYNILLRGLRRIFPGLFRSTAILPRKGIVGDWRNYFNKECTEIFQNYAGNELIELGYIKK